MTDFKPYRVYCIRRDYADGLYANDFYVRQDIEDFATLEEAEARRARAIQGDFSGSYFIDRIPDPPKVYRVGAPDNVHYLEVSLEGQGGSGSGDLRIRAAPGFNTAAQSSPVSTRPFSEQMASMAVSSTSFRTSRQCRT